MRHTSSPGRALLAPIFAATLLALGTGPVRAQTAADQRPSVLLIVTDDQRWDTLWAMPQLQRLLVDRGVTFTNSFVSSPLCCPSRASILTGAYPHTTGVYTQGLPNGGFKRFNDTTTIATELHDAGYRTGFFGKYLDSYQSDALSGYVPPGWDRWMAFVHSQFFDYDLTIDGEVKEFGSSPADYSTDVLAERTEAFIRRTGGPFFAIFAPAAPHSPATPAPADEGGFADLPPWSPPSFNEADVADKPWDVARLHRLTPTKIAALEELRRDQYRSLQAVDRAVARLIDALADTGRLERTLVIFTSDNGLLWGEHRWQKKEMPYEEAIRVPLVIRDDAVVADVPRTEEQLVGNIDLAPTIAELAGTDLPKAEGKSLLPLLAGEQVRWRHALLVEHMKMTNPVPTYCAVRTDRYLYATYVTGETELYDLREDPYELENLAGRRPPLEARLATTLRSLCNPPPLGLRPQVGAAATTLGAAVVIAIAAAARMALARSGRRRR
jgi:N-acetylglucosamine-6-sulfatase